MRRSLSLRIRYLFLKLQILLKKEKPEPEQTVEDKPKKAQKAKKLKEEKPKEKKTLDQFLSILELVKQAVESIKKPLGFLLRSLKFRHISLRIVTAQEDAHQTALRYGQTCAAVYGTWAFLRNVMDVQVDDIDIQADFIHEEEQFFGKGSLKIAPIAGLIFALWFLGSFGWRFFRSKLEKSNEEKGAKKAL